MADNATHDVTEAQQERADDEAVPKAIVRPNSRRFPIVWIVPLVAAIVAGYVIYDRVKQFGPNITIRFKDGTGVRIGQTQIKYRGVQIGEVTAVELSKDHNQALVKARLRRTAASIAQEGAVFWIVRPEVGLNNITGLGTVISGPEIQVIPGKGEAKDEFEGLDKAPVEFERKGLKIVLRATRPASLRPNSPVYYRGVEVGVVQDVTLSSNATMTDVHVLIRQRFANLVHPGSVFWNVSGANFSAGLFRGLEIKLESLRSLVAGGVEFATPDEGRHVKDGTVFPLYAEAKKEWQEWAPRIAIPPEK